VTIRIGKPVVERIDALAETGGLTRAQMLRIVLSRVTESDLPVGLVESADLLREANGVA
jgi:antitoxin component of RelBE/YafQ-DinJ toxin-antitoxin module